MQDIRNLLGNVGLEGHAHTIKNKDLSGGQKARVVFAELMLAQPHIIFFDEPTNHLDIESVDALCDAIRAFNGGVVLVTHDARLITEVRVQVLVRGVVSAVVGVPLCLRVRCLCFVDVQLCVPVWRVRSIARIVGGLSLIHI